MILKTVDMLINELNNITSKKVHLISPKIIKLLVKLIFIKHWLPPLNVTFRNLFWAFFMSLLYYQHKSKKRTGWFYYDESVKIN